MTISPQRVTHQAPAVSAFAELRSLVGWKNPSLAVLQQSMDASLFWVTVYVDNRLIGVGRVIGDGAMYFYIQDVIVHPEHQNGGVGVHIMQAINQYLEATCVAGATVGLMAAKGKEPFYEKFGFALRDGEHLGMGMCRFV